MRSNKVFLQHIQDEINFLLRETRGLTFDEFMNNEVLKRACARSFEIIAGGALLDRRCGDTTSANLHQSLLLGQVPEMIGGFLHQ